MKRGNDFKVILNVYRKREPEDFTDAYNIIVIVSHMKCKWVKFQPVVTVINGNKMEIPIPVEYQKEDGAYRIDITYTKDAKERPKRFEASLCNAFILDSGCCQQMPGDGDCFIYRDVDIQVIADGKDGATPYVGENGNWWIESIDTGKPSRGEPGTTQWQGIENKPFESIDGNLLIVNECGTLSVNQKLFPEKSPNDDKMYIQVNGKNVELNSMVATTVVEI